MEVTEGLAPQPTDKLKHVLPLRHGAVGVEDAGHGTRSAEGIFFEGRFGEIEAQAGFVGERGNYAASSRFSTRRFPSTLSACSIWSRGEGCPRSSRRSIWDFRQFSLRARSAKTTGGK